MSNQTKLALTGVAGVVGAKFFLHKDWRTALFYGTAVVAVVALFTAKNTTDNAA